MTPCGEEEQTRRERRLTVTPTTNVISIARKEYHRKEILYGSRASSWSLDLQEKDRLVRGCPRSAREWHHLLHQRGEGCVRSGAACGRKRQLLIHEVPPIDGNLHADCHPPDDPYPGDQPDEGSLQ